MAAGADIDAVHEIPDYGEVFPATALWHALVWGRNRALGAYLLARGAIRCAEWLLREGADSRVPDHRGYTALHHAVRRRLPAKTLRLLVRCGADHAAAGDGLTVGKLATRTQRRSLGID